jgi:hypothetical protein
MSLSTTALSSICPQQEPSQARAAARQAPERILRIAWAQVALVARVVAEDPAAPVVPLISGGAAQAGPAV